MGIYVYTLRKNPIVAIDNPSRAPITVGITKYAYKDSGRWDGGSDYKRMVGRSLAQAQKARDHNPKLTMVTIGDPKEHNFDRYGPMPVFQVSDQMTCFYDTKPPGPRVGCIWKSGKGYEFMSMD
jgi:hypothetical protein